MSNTPPCPICESPHTLFARALADGADRPLVDLFVCLACRSAASPWAEPIRPHSALSWHIQVAQRNAEYANSLFHDLGLACPVVLDIGCGTGTLIAAARALGGGGVGFDVDEASCAYGRDLGLDLRAELWRPTSAIPPVNLITCIMVLEHLHQPRPLLGELIEASNRYRCPLFVAVPFFTRAWWRYLTEPVSVEFHPFRDPRIHVSHFSPEGFEIAANALGAQSVKPLLGRKGWPGYLVNDLFNPAA